MTRFTSNDDQARQPANWFDCGEANCRSYHALVADAEEKMHPPAET
jgi:hypothetical protein